MSMFGLNFGGVSGFAGDASPKQQRQPLPSTSSVPAFLFQPQAPGAVQPHTPSQTPRHAPPPTPAAQSQKSRNGNQESSQSERTAGKHSSGRNGATDQTATGGLNPARIEVFQKVERREDEERKEEEGQNDDEGSANDSATKEELAAMATGDLDCEALVDEITQQLGQQGIFEVIMPDGNTLGVVVNVDDKKAQFLLSPSDDTLAELLKNGKMELQGRLAQRMNKDVDISLL